MSAESTTVATPQTKVFNITELTEYILLMLPYHKVQGARLVCKRWNIVLRGSLRVRKMLFLHPGKAKDCFKRFVRDFRGLCNMMIMPFWYPDPPDRIRHAFERLRAAGCDSIAVNPLLLGFLRGRDKG
jgi:hypothetical protein